jgi:hypothetical protein
MARFVLATGALVCALAMGIPIQRAHAQNGCSQCSCYYPNSGQYGVILGGGGCIVCGCYVKIQ